MTNLPALREAAHRMNFCGCPGAYRGMLCQACSADARHLKSALPALLDEVEALKARTCATCRHASHGDIDLWCTRWSPAIPSSSDVMCADILTCGAWAAKEGA